MSQPQSPVHTLEASEAPTLTDSPLASSFVKPETHNHSESKHCTPPSNHARTLVLCFDGTGDQFDSDNSNIVEFFTLLKKGDPDRQLVYYQAGIGTYFSPQIATPFASRISKLLDEAVAWNLSTHVMDGYEFLMQNYRADDRICIFGFSRGAYTARGLAGMIHKVGLLPACNHQQVPFAYKMYTRMDDIGWKQSNAFKKAFSMDIPIEFLGVWDTVNSVGLVPRRLPFTTSNTMVRTFRHAIALDERRAKFKANLWNRPNDKESKLGIKTQQPIENLETQQDDEPEDDHDYHDEHKHEHEDDDEKQKKNGKHKPTQRHMERQYSDPCGFPTDIKEVWFAGCHCDVGGGSVENGTPHTLARIPLRWMIRECFKAETGIMFITEGLREIGLEPTHLHPIVQPRPPALSVAGFKVTHHPPKPKWFPLRKKKSIASTSAADHPTPASVSGLSEEEHEVRDSMTPIYDQLKLKSHWWILELFPVKQRFQKSDDSWRSMTSMNLGRGRFIPKQKKSVIEVHRSVKLRMDAEGVNGKRYEPKASFKTALDMGNVEWVD